MPRISLARLLLGALVSSLVAVTFVPAANAAAPACVPRPDVPEPLVCANPYYDANLGICLWAFVNPPLYKTYAVSLTCVPFDCPKNVCTISDRTDPPPVLP